MDGQVDRFGFLILFCFVFWGGCILFLFLLLCMCSQYVLMFITVMVNIKIWLMGKIMNFSYSKGKEPGVCIPRVIAVPYLKFHCEKVILRNSPECAALGTASGKAELVGTRSTGSAARSCLLGPLGLLLFPYNGRSKCDCSCPASLVFTSWNWE